MSPRICMSGDKRTPTSTCVSLSRPSKSRASPMPRGTAPNRVNFLIFFVLFCFFKKRLDNRSKETTFVYGTFAGYLRSQVQCLSCKFRSNTFDAFLDLSLDILHADSIAKALNGFTKPERLEGDNQYHCSRFFFFIE